MLLERARSMRSDPTAAEDKLWQRLRAGRLNGLKFLRQVAFSGKYIADFVCPSAKLVLELDGSQHAEQLTYDAARTRFFESQGYRVMRFWNNDVLGNIHTVLESIARAALAPLPGASRLSLPPEGEGRP